MTREQIAHRTPERTEDSASTDIPPSGVDAEKLKANLDEVLDSIDEVLLENAAEFVDQFVQKGGE